jgi:DNA-binding LacI/PurR family transcriptional regulator/DNA-binding MarR family transcriptional regulator
MADFRVRTATEQVADYLREAIARRHWGGRLPGGSRLAKDLGVGKSTIEGALALLEADGLLIPQGDRRSRRIDLSRVIRERRWNIEILLYEESDRKLDYLLEIQYKLQQAGHVTTFSDKTLTSLRMEVGRVARYVEGVEADAWVVVGGNRGVLEYFADRPDPAYALFGRQDSVAIPGSVIDNTATLVGAVERLIALGHRRIVTLTREERRKPTPGLFERLFLETLSRHGIQPGAYNLPDWDEGPGGLQRCLDALYEVTPPTALIIAEPHLFLATQMHLARQGILAPRDVSMLCCDSDSAFRAFEPMIAHLRWDTTPLVRNVTRWSGQIRQYKHPRRKSVIEAEFIEGGTIGLVRGA